MQPIFQAAMIGALLSAVFTAPVFAQNGGHAKTVEVFIGDLDLSKEAGQDALHTRLMGAAQSVCHRAGDSIRVIGERTERKECIESALETAYASLTPGRPYAQLNR